MTKIIIIILMIIKGIREILKSFDTAYISNFQSNGCSAT